jgi:predicted acetyltransferase
MNSAQSLPPDVEVLPAEAEQEPVLANLLELYAHDFSELLDLRLGPDGRFGYPGLSRYWTEEGRVPFLVTVEGEPAGFVLVRRGSRVREAPGVWDVAEFFIARRHRKRGIGAAVAHEVWRRFPGAWEVRVLDDNAPARAFWAAAIGAFTGTAVEAFLVEERDRRWHVFSLRSPPTAGMDIPEEPRMRGSGGGAG